MGAYLILPLNSPRIRTCNTVIYIFNIRITIWKLHTVVKRLEICIDINTEFSEVDHYTWIFTSRIFRIALEVTFLLNKYFFLQMVCESLSQSRKLNKRGWRSLPYWGWAFSGLLTDGGEGGGAKKNPSRKFVTQVQYRWKLGTVILYLNKIRKNT